MTNQAVNCDSRQRGHAASGGYCLVDSINEAGRRRAASLRDVVVAAPSALQLEPPLMEYCQLPLLASAV